MGYPYFAGAPAIVGDCKHQQLPENNSNLPQNKDLRLVLSVLLLALVPKLDLSTFFTYVLSLS